MKQSIQAFIYPDGNGYVAECTDVNAVTQGDTLDQTLANLKEVIALALTKADASDYDLAPNPSVLVTMELGPLPHAG